jgi:hypothetical protein
VDNWASTASLGIIIIASIDQLVPTLELIKQAVEAGELDALMYAAGVKLRDGFWEK